MSIESATMNRVGRRLLPLLIVCYFAAYLDRNNVGFAALGMNKELGFNPSVYATGAGIFFISYFFFELPSNLILHLVGARIWIARIMLVWGLIAAAMAFIPDISMWLGASNSTTFITLRMLLGIAEAGFFPGVLFYLSIWFPSSYRARITALFMAAIPLASLIGAPISGALLYINLWGLSGWQWMYLIEAIPAILLSGVVFIQLTEVPEQAAWLAPDQRAWLTARLSIERETRRKTSDIGVIKLFTNPRIFLLAFISFAMNGTNYGLGFFLPQIVKGFGLSNATVGLVVAIPYVLGIVAMFLWGRHSDRLGERSEHIAVALMMASLCLAGACIAKNAVSEMILLSLAIASISAAQPCFWALAANFTVGSASAALMAIVNSIGSLAGFFGPYLMGTAKESSGNYSAAFLGISAILGFAMLVSLSFDRSDDRNPKEFLDAEKL